MRNDHLHDTLPAPAARVAPPPNFRTRLLLFIAEEMNCWYPEVTYAMYHYSRLLLSGELAPFADPATEWHKLPAALGMAADETETTPGGGYGLRWDPELWEIAVDSVHALGDGAVGTGQNEPFRLGYWLVDPVGYEDCGITPLQLEQHGPADPLAAAAAIVEASDTGVHALRHKIHELRGSEAYHQVIMVDIS